MYESHWHLQCRPFDEVADPAFYYPCQSHQGALLKLRYALDYRQGAALLCGAPGTGKTLVTRLLLRQLHEQLAPRVHLVFPQLTPTELLAYLADELAAPEADNSHYGTERCLQRLVRALRENAALNQTAVIVVDEAQLLADPERLECLRLLLNLREDTDQGLSLLLVGQPALLPILQRMPALEERLAVKCLLRAMTYEETISYVHHRVHAAGGDQIFHESALEALYRLTQGNPRRINRLCDLALLIAYADDEQQVRGEHLEAVAEELVHVVPE
jgi:general secretion pathway protein A